jgi:hypothetical protein
MELVSDKSGSMSFGWVAAGVYLVRASGEISASLAALQLSRLEAALDEQAPIRYFSDGRDIKGYDLLARSAFVRFVLSQRKKFSELTVLTWSEGISTAGQTFASAIGDPLILLSSASEFDRRLFLAAPHVKDAQAPSPKLRAAAY